MKLFNITNLSFAYGKQVVLQNVSLSYDSSDFLAIIGANGSGKSTLAKLILGLLNSHNAIERFIPRAQIAYVPQNTNANENFPIRVLEVVLMGLIHEKMLGFYSKADKLRAFKALESVGIAELWDKRLGDISGGERQRAFIARAMIAQCSLLILDEPTANVDSKTSIQIFEILAALHKQGVGIVVISHDINIVLAYANKIAYLNKELFLHDNDMKKSQFIKHLFDNHGHFCDVEMSADSCVCGDSGNIKDSSDTMDSGTMDSGVKDSGNV